MPSTREADRYRQRIVRDNRKSKGLCVKCGRRPAEEGYVGCRPCKREQHRYYLKRKLLQDAKIGDYIIANNLVSTKEVTEILHCCISWTHKLTYSGILKPVKFRFSGSRYYRRKDIMEFKSTYPGKRLKKNTPNHEL